MTEKQINYLNKINSIFVGQKIKNVHYEVILYEDQEYWEFSNEIHSVDMNVIFELDNNKFFKVLWDNEFECYGIGVYEINELKPADSFKLIKVSDNINWKSKIGKKITSINVFWDELESQNLKKVLNYLIPFGKKTKTNLPTTWNIMIETESIWISSLEIYSNDKIFHFTDHLTIMFNEKDLITYSVLPNPSEKL
ncbi:hypothetical protein ACTS94_13380 [Empedobacter falsenii]